MPAGRPITVMVPLAVLIACYALLPVGLVRDVGYVVVGAACVAAALIGVAHQPPPRRANWLLVLGGIAGWVVGDLLVLLQDDFLRISAYPAPSDAVYIASYGLIGAGLVRMVRHRGGGGDLAAILDAAILATGVAVIAGVFVIAPAAMDSSLSTSGRLTSSLYPIADVVLLGLLVRLWTTPGARTPAFRLLAAALGLTLLGDALYNIRVILTADTASSTLNDMCWLAGYALVAGALWAAPVHRDREVGLGREDFENPRRRLIILTAGLLLPGLTLMIKELAGGDLVWPVIAGGSVLLSILVLSRMAGLLGVVSAQAIRLAALARSDPLTGVANRRTWDHELSRACRVARDDDSPLTIALLDLDHFKSYNDKFGHLAGDRLLREATAAWTDLLTGAELLSRYGGEEFAVLFPGLTPAQAADRVHVLLDHTPDGQTFSAGLASWTPGSDPTSAVDQADRALYAAKRDGRNQVRTAANSDDPLQVRPTIVLQPIVDLGSQTVIGVEALSRFATGEPTAVFENAYRSGRGPDLEAAVITSARSVRPPGQFVAINIAIGALSSPPVQRALAGDLRGVVLEVTEHTAGHHTAQLGPTLADYRSRGAVFAVDDWGTGYSDTARLLLLRPEIVKIDMSIVQGSDTRHYRAAIAGLMTWASAVGATVCAEGIETEDDLQRMRDLGIHLGQGYLFGHPAAPATTSAPAV